MFEVARWLLYVVRQVSHLSSDRLVMTDSAIVSSTEFKVRKNCLKHIIRLGDSDLVKLSTAYSKICLR